MKFDIFDIAAFAGAALIAAGVWAIYPPAALILTGAALVWLGSTNNKDGK